MTQGAPMSERSTVPAARTSSAARQKNVRLALILGSVAGAFLIGFVAKIILLSPA